jgi:UDP:flavonoid glycosyltransferase YjiC (YdhE family)
MARILLAWELGDGLGHIMRLLPLAKRLRQAGHDCVFAVRNVPTSYGVIAREGFPVLQAPMLVPYAPQEVRAKPIATYGDIIATIGFDDVDRLLPMVEAWQGLIDVVQPALVVGDYAPTVGLTTYGTFPLVLVGDGFTLPPPNLPKFPVFRSSGARVPEEQLLAVVQETQRRRGRPAPSTLPAILAARETFIITLPELDFYRAHRPRPAVGPLTSLPPPVTVPPEVDYFCYLSLSYRHTGKVLDGLIASGRSGSCYIRDADKGQIQHLRASGLIIHDQPPPLAEMGAKAGVIVHHGGLGTTETAMALGRPQILVPRHGEQNLNARGLGRLGIAAQMKGSGDFSPHHVVQALNGVLGTPAFAARAAAHARDIAKRGPQRALDVISGYCRDLIAGKA